MTLSKLKFICYAEAICPATHKYIGKNIDPNIEQYSITSIIRCSRAQIAQTEKMAQGIRRHEQLFNLLDGKSCESDDVIQALYKQIRLICTAINYEFEKKMVFQYNDIYIVGSIDIVTKHIIFEIKTGEIKSDDHILQLKLYMHLLSVATGNENKTGYVVYRDSSVRVFQDACIEDKLISLLEKLIKDEQTETIKIEDVETVKLYKAKIELEKMLDQVKETLNIKTKPLLNGVKYDFGGVLFKRTLIETNRIDSAKVKNLPDEIKKDLYKKSLSERAIWGLTNE